MIARAASTAVLALLLVQQGVAGQTVPDRIRSGDWIWDSGFLLRDGALYGYAGGFVRQVRMLCPDYGSEADERRFLLGLQWHPGNIPGQLNALPEGSARADARAMVEAVGCADRGLQAFMTNARRILVGRRPAQARPGILVDEKINPLDARHRFDHTLVGLQSPAIIQLDRDVETPMAEFPQPTILECHYDEDTEDERREVQYYWGYSALTFTLGLSYLHIPWLTNLQTRLQRLNGSIPAKHPFLEFGAPRDECPPVRDRELPIKTIRYAPRVRPEAPTGPVAPPAKTTRGCRSEYACRNQHIFEYGPVPEHYVPEWPDPLPADWREIRIYLDEAFPGSVEIMALQRFYMGHARGWSHISWERAGRTADADLVQQDIDAAAERGLPIVRCMYAGADVLFWYQRADELVGRDRLRGRVRDHPLLRIGDPLETCPPSREEALARRGS